MVRHVADWQPAPEYEVQGITRQVLAALAHLHDTVGIYHRDVKLGNFRFRGDPADSALVLLDFGFGGSIEGPYDGILCGTTVFMAPEVSGRVAEPPHLAAMDLWSAGVVLYVLLTGDQPFQEHEARFLGRAHHGGGCGPLLQKAFQAQELDLVSDAAIALLRRLLDVEPGNRITAAQALQHRWFV
uniref:Protein kinase domain-containing protein n=1 Tax=Alexandrium catenella TaxID=2925 RepID=A0A7S1PML1_ALECA